MRHAPIAVLLLVLGCGFDAESPPPPQARDLSAYACGHSTCNGCCSGGVCVSGYASEACGLLGQVCDVCKAPQVCSATRRCADAPKPKEAEYKSPDYGSPPAGEPNPERPGRCYSTGVTQVCE